MGMPVGRGTQGAPNIFIRMLMRYLIGYLRKSDAHNFMAWGLYDKKYDTHYRLEIGKDNDFTLIRGREKAIDEICSVIWLKDSSDYIHGLWSALEALSPSIAEKLRNDEWRPGE